MKFSNYKNNKNVEQKKPNQKYIINAQGSAGLLVYNYKECILESQACIH